MLRKMVTGLLICGAASCALPDRTQQEKPETDETYAEAVRTYVREYVDFGAFDGVVLLARGENIVFHEAFGFADYRHRLPMAVDARFRIASLSKQFTQAAIARLVAEETLALNSRISQFLPDFPRGKEITVLQLLDHTAGIPHTNRLAWMDMQEPLALEEIVSGLAAEPLDFEPGSQSRYSNGGYAIAAAVIEAASGRSYADYIQQEIAERGLPSVGHETAYETVTSMAHRYAPGATVGSRVEATPYLTANRVGGGSLYANAEDLFRFFRTTLRGTEMSDEIHSALFAMPEDGDIRITGRSPGALAQVYYDVNEDLTVVTLSSNSAWPGTFNRDITELFRGNPVKQLPVRLLAEKEVAEDELNAIAGAYEPERFSWDIRLERTERGIVYVQNESRVAFRKTEDGVYYLSIWDWLCTFENRYESFTCRQRDPTSQSAFVFHRVGAMSAP
ncbi:MAG: serine hydrolase domain-containing protein [Pseudomonadota bacterium]